MQFRSQAQAKKFFVDKIVLQAQKEQISLSDAEKYMLYWTETEKGFDFDQNLTNRFREEITEAKYEKKICALIRNAYKADISRDSGPRNEYENAYRTLAKGDHYVLVMIAKALHDFRLNIKPDNGLKDKILLFLTALGITFVPLITAILLHLHDHWVDFMFACYLFLIIYFGYSHVTFSLKNESISKRLKIYLFQFVVALILIGIYTAIFKYNFVDIQSHSTRHGSGFDYIVMLPLLGLSIFLLDFWLKRGIVYDGITGYISKLGKKD